MRTNNPPCLSLHQWYWGGPSNSRYIFDSLPYSMPTLLHRMIYSKLNTSYSPMSIQSTYAFPVSSVSSGSVGSSVRTVSSPTISTMTGFSWNSAAANRLLQALVRADPLWYQSMGAAYLFFGCMCAIMSGVSNLIFSFFVPETRSQYIQVQSLDADSKLLPLWDQLDKQKLIHRDEYCKQISQQT